MQRSSTRALRERATRGLARRGMSILVGRVDGGDLSDARHEVAIVLELEQLEAKAHAPFCERLGVHEYPALEEANQTSACQY